MTYLYTKTKDFAYVQMYGSKNVLHDSSWNVAVIYVTYLKKRKQKFIFHMGLGKPAHDTKSIKLYTTKSNQGNKTRPCIFFMTAILLYNFYRCIKSLHIHCRSYV